MRGLIREVTESSRNSLQETIKSQHEQTAKNLHKSSLKSERSMETFNQKENRTKNKPSNPHKLNANILKTLGQSKQYSKMNRVKDIKEAKIKIGNMEVKPMRKSLSIINPLLLNKTLLTGTLNQIFKASLDNIKKKLPVNTKKMNLMDSFLLENK